MAKYIRSPQAINTQIVALGVDTYLKMLLADNFVHTDLHPGNILVRVRGVSAQSVRTDSCCIHCASMKGSGLSSSPVLHLLMHQMWHLQRHAPPFPPSTSTQAVVDASIQAAETAQQPNSLQYNSHSATLL